MDLATRVRVCRTMVPELSARELAALAELPPPTVSNIERSDDARPGDRIAAKTIVALARVLGTTAEWLMTGEGDAPTAADVTAAIEAARASRSTPTAPAA